MTNTAKQLADGLVDARAMIKACVLAWRALEERK